MSLNPALAPCLDLDPLKRNVQNLEGFLTSGPIMHSFLLGCVLALINFGVAIYSTWLDDSCPIGISFGGMTSPLTCSTTAWHKQHSNSKWEALWTLHQLGRKRSWKSILSPKLSWSCTHFSMKSWNPSSSPKLYHLHKAYHLQIPLTFLYSEVHKSSWSKGYITVGIPL